MKTRLGIIGCGQLSQMMAEAARRLDVSVSFLCVDETPVVQGLGDIYPVDQLDAFLTASDAITVERESIPDAILRRAAEEVGLAPRYEALVTLRQRDTQKTLFNTLQIATSPWAQADSREELYQAFDRLNCGYARCKRILGGYDGGGQWRIHDKASIEAIPDGGYPLIVEAEIDIDRELAIVIARDHTGASVCYPVTENFMRSGILLGSIVPAEVDHQMTRLAEAHARALVDAMDYVGVLAVEFFVSGGELIVNEIAPRVHNTGHWTIGATGRDQFNHHIRLVLGDVVEQPVFSESAAIINLLDERLPAVMPGAPVRMLMQTYGKGVRKGRKLGHLTVIGPDAGAIRELAAELLEELHPLP